MIVGFSFNKISAEKKSPIKGKLEITRNIVIKDIKEEKIPDGKGVVVEFEFNVAYEPKIAVIDLGGSLFYLTDNVKGILEDWKKNKKLSDGQATYDVVNAILMKCNVRSLQISDEMNLPPTLRLPRVNPKEDASVAG